MENTAIKVHVTPDIYEIIKDIQINLREKEGKKTSLAKIMLRLTQKGIESLQNKQKTAQNTQKNTDITQNKEDFVQNTKHFTPKSEGKNLIISSKESKFIDELRVRQEYLADREAELRELEVELYDDREKLIEKNRELLQLEEALLKKQYEIKYNSIENSLIKKINNQSKEDNFLARQTVDKIKEKELNNIFVKLSDVKEQLSEIKRETKQENFIKYFELLNENDSRIMHLIEKSNQKSTLEKLEPILPAALNAIVTFIMKNKQNIKSVEIANEIKALVAEEKNEESAASEKSTQ